MVNSVSIAIRRSNGDVVNLRQWEKNIAEMIVNPKTLDETGLMFELLTSEWSTDVNVPFAPYGHGLIVLDFKEKKIHSMQHYCALDVRIFDSERYPMYFLKDVIADESSDLFAVKGFMSNGTLKSFKFIDVATGDEITVPAEKVNFDDIALLMSNEGKDNMAAIIEKIGLPSSFSLFSFEIDNPFEIISYPKSSSSITPMWEALAAAGFTFTQKDVDAWNDVRSDYAEHERGVQAQGK